MDETQKQKPNVYGRDELATVTASARTLTMDTDTAMDVYTSTEGNNNLFVAPRPQRARRGGSTSRGSRCSSVSGRGTPACESGDDSDESIASASVVSLDRPTTRRGRPPTTGEYVGLAKAKERLVEAKRKELELRAEERSLDRSLPPRPSSKSSIPLPEQEELERELRYEPMAALAAQSLELTDDVERVASISKGLKGTCQRSLRVAARRIRAINVEMAKRGALDNAADEVAELRRQLRLRDEQLAKQVEQTLNLSRELAEVKARLGAVEAPIFMAPAHAERPIRLASPFLERVGANKRSRPDEGALSEPVAGPSWMEMEPPAPIKSVPKIRRVEKVDPEGGDIRVCIAALMQQVSSLREEFMGVLSAKGRENPPPKKEERAGGAKPAPKPKPKGERQVKATPQAGTKESPLEARMRGIQEETRLAAQGETWATVVGRKAKRSQKQEGPPPTTGGPAAKKGQQGTKAPPKKAPAPAAKKAKPARPPKTAAVTLTLAPDAKVTYAEVMATAREKVDLKTIGITEIRPRRAVTGGLVLEIPGEGRTDKATALEGCLQGVFRGTEVRVSRPVKMGEVRVSGLDDSVSPADVTAALAAVGGCTPAEVKVGEIRISPARLGTVWARCPLTALGKIVASGRILVGWSSARVEALPARPLQCFRCLEKGHVRQRCTCEVDRSDRCYVCGESGHKASSCSATPRCPLCTDLGRPAGHRLGAKSCALNPRGRRRRAPSRGK
uniref:uncharacterized protein LOC117611491 n=1 Tax=Osmia lignaria TaxID=473952 RepID=UPI0014790F41|nr:uncharacterized protein LOC117611491 [Osmia lignaria]